MLQESALERVLVIVWGMEKFHNVLSGAHFILQTDQKPLVSIVRKKHDSHFSKNSMSCCQKLSVFLLSSVDFWQTE